MATQQNTYPGNINLNPNRIPVIRDYSKRIAATLNADPSATCNLGGMIILSMVNEIPDLSTEERMALVWSITQDTSKSLYQEKFFRILKTAMESM